MSVSFRQRSAAAVGWGLIALWAWWWTQSLAAGWLIGNSWVPAWRTLGWDFSHNFVAVHLLAGGINPYRHTVDFRGFYAYPPLVLVLFFGARLFSASQFTAAAGLWFVILAVIMILAARSAWLTRQALRLPRISRPLIVGAVLLCTPVVFAMERGNCDALVLLFLLLAAAAMHRNRKSADCVAGLLLAAAMWIKIYPGLVLLSVIALRRWRVLIAGIICGLLIGLIPLPATIQFFQASRQSEGYRVEFLSSAVQLHIDPAKAQSSGLNYYPPLETVSHSLPIYWQTFWNGVHLHGLAVIPGMIGAGLILAPLLIWVCRAMTAAPNVALLIYPYFLFVALLATFWMPVSYDYNLIYLPILAVTVWDARDPWPIQLLLAPFLIYWQPWDLHVPMQILLLLKLMALYGLAMCLRRRAMRLTAS